MKIEDLTNYLKRWIKDRITAIVTIHIHEGGIRKVRIEQDVK